LLLARSGIIGGLVGVADEYVIIASFLAGLFFTSFFTTAPAVVALGQIALNNNIAIVSVFGALGAVCGDAINGVSVRDLEEISSGRNDLAYSLTRLEQIMGSVEDSTYVSFQKPTH
jgi:hypothetical protein